MTDRTVRLRADTSPLLACLARADALLAAPEALPEFREGLFDLLDVPEQLVALQVHVLATTNAFEMVVQFDPSDRLLGLVAAGGAGNAQ